MKAKFLRELLNPHIYLDLVVMVVLCIIIASLKVWFGVACIAGVFAVWLLHGWYEKLSLKLVDDYTSDLLRDSDKIMHSVAAEDTLAFCTVDKKGKVTWSNKGFSEICKDQNIRGGLFDEDQFDSFFEGESITLDIKLGDSSYTVHSSKIGDGSESVLLSWHDVSTLASMKERYEASRTCIAAVSVDNYDELISSTTVDEQSAVAAEIDRTIRTWAGNLNAGAFRYRDNSYVLFFEEKYLSQIRESNFSLLDEMHGIVTGADFPTSVSIGVAYGENTLADKVDESLAAMDLALGRGGDQAVLVAPGTDNQYFGGTLPTVEKRNKGKSRIVSHALMLQMKASDQIFIMGHARPDMDSFGSSIGVASLARFAGKPHYIILNAVDEAIEQIYNAAVETEQYNFLNQDEALEMMTKDTLLVVTDHHNARVSEAPKLAEAARRIAIIDHHRRTKDAIANPTLAHTEVYASSASELVTELIQYALDKNDLTRFEADALLAGITVDTKNFTTSAGVRTFEAASWLKRKGADSNVVRGFFKQRLEFVQKKYNLIASTQVLGKGIAIAYTKEQDPTMQVLVAQAADELLDMQGIYASFAAGVGATKTMVSARSNGQLNVQTIMEYMGGGGHMNVAAAQVEESPEEAIQKLVQYLREEEII